MWLHRPCSSRCPVSQQPLETSGYHVFSHSTTSITKVPAGKAEELPELQLLTPTFT